MSNSFYSDHKDNVVLYYFAHSKTAIKHKIHSSFLINNMLAARTQMALHHHRWYFKVNYMMSEMLLIIQSWGGAGPRTSQCVGVQLHPTLSRPPPPSALDPCQAGVCLQETHPLPHPPVLHDPCVWVLFLAGCTNIHLRLGTAAALKKYTEQHMRSKENFWIQSGSPSWTTLR